MPIFADGQTSAKDTVVYASHRAVRSAGWGIARITRETWRPEFTPQMRETDNATLFWCVSGAGRIEYGGKTASIRPGTLLISGIETYVARSVPDTPLTFLLISLQGPAVPELLDRCLPQAQSLLVPGKTHEINEQFEKIFSIAKAGGPMAQDLCTHYVPVLLMEISRALQPEQQHSQSMLQYIACRDYIERHVETMSSVLDAADYVGITPSYMNRLFREHDGSTPNAYYQRLRMNHAAHLLQVTNDSIKTIALDMGFADGYAFSKAFKRVMGVSPKEYRSGVNLQLD